jgi:hypothetical protein
MKRLMSVAVISWFAAGPLGAHVTPPVIFWFDGAAIARLLPGSGHHYSRDVALNEEQRTRIQERCGWRAMEPAYRFFLGRNARGELVGAVIFLSETTVHGPVRVGIALSANGSVLDAVIVQSTEEAANWSRALNDRGFARYSGMDAADHFTVAEGGDEKDMVLHYEQLVVRLIHRAAVLFKEAGVDEAAPGTGSGR